MHIVVVSTRMGLETRLLRQLPPSLRSIVCVSRREFVPRTETLPQGAVVAIDLTAIPHPVPSRLPELARCVVLHGASLPGAWVPFLRLAETIEATSGEDACVVLARLITLAASQLTPEAIAEEITRGSPGFQNVGDIALAILKNPKLRYPRDLARIIGCSLPALRARVQDAGFAWTRVDHVISGVRHIAHEYLFHRGFSEATAWQVVGGGDKTNFRRSGRRSASVGAKPADKAGFEAAGLIHAPGHHHHFHVRIKRPGSD